MPVPGLDIGGIGHRAPSRQTPPTPFTLAVGDILMSGRLSLPYPYLAASGGVALKAAYPLLAAALNTPQTTLYSPAVPLANPATIPAGITYGVAWSPDGRYVAFGGAGSPYVNIYDMLTNAPVKIANPAALPTGIVRGVAWSPDGRFLALAHDTSPYVTVYDWVTGSPVKISNPASLPAGNGLSVTFAADGQRLVVGHAGSPFMSIYPFSASGFGTKLSNPASLPAGQVQGCALSPSGRYAAVAMSVSPYFSVFDLVTGTPVKETDPASAPPGDAKCIQWYGGGRYIAVGHDGTTKGVTFYDFANETQPVFQLTYNASYPVAGLDLSPDAKYLGLAVDSGGGTVFRAMSLENPASPSGTWQLNTAPSGAFSFYDVAWAPHGRFVAAAFGPGGAAMAILDMRPSDGFNPLTEFKLPNVTNGWVKAA